MESRLAVRRLNNFEPFDYKSCLQRSLSVLVRDHANNISYCACVGCVAMSCAVLCCPAMSRALRHRLVLRYVSKPLQAAKMKEKATDRIVH